MMVSPDAPRPPHACTKHRPGNLACYSRHGCRCRSCADARSRYMKRRAHNLPTGTDKLIDGTGTRRRLQALARLGWSSAVIAQRIGSWESAVRRLRRAEHCMASVASVIASVYDDLSMQVPSKIGHVKRTATFAERQGWPPPLSWDDGFGPHGIDNPDATPYVGKSRPEPTADRITWLFESGQPLAAVCQQLGISRSGVEKALKRAGLDDLWRRMREAA